MNDIHEDPRVMRTKNLIIDAFLTLIKEKDFNAISIKDITERATINRATFYRHFSDKYVLLEKIVHQIMMKQAFDQGKKKSELNEETFQTIVYSFCDLVEELQQTFGRNYDTVVMLTENSLKTTLIDMIITFLHSGDTEKNTFIAIMLVTSIYSASCAWISHHKHIPREAFFEMILPFLMGSISQF